jgi:hypothetical protein
VAGSRRAIAACGPSPGRTPTSVPPKHPKKAHNRFIGVKQTWNPKVILSKKPISYMPRIPMLRGPSGKLIFNQTAKNMYEIHDTTRAVKREYVQLFRPNVLRIATKKRKVDNENPKCIRAMV